MWKPRRCLAPGCRSRRTCCPTAAIRLAAAGAAHGPDQTLSAETSSLSQAVIIACRPCKRSVLARSPSIHYPAPHLLAARGSASPGFSDAAWARPGSGQTQRGSCLEIPPGLHPLKQVWGPGQACQEWVQHGNPPVPAHRGGRIHAVHPADHLVDDLRAIWVVPIGNGAEHAVGLHSSAADVSFQDVHALAAGRAGGGSDGRARQWPC